MWANFVHYDRAKEVSGYLPSHCSPYYSLSFLSAVLVYQFIILQFVYTELRICLDCPETLRGILLFISFVPKLLICIHFFHQIVWLLEFQTFDDKSSAISVGTSINKQLTEMIMKRRNPGQTLVVGKQEYKSIIESSLVSVS